MHELSLAEALVRQVDEIMAEEEADTVLRVYLIIGELSGVERDAFEFVFPMAVEDTCLENAELMIEEQPARVVCQDCKNESTPTLPMVNCGHCGSTNVRLISGRDFRIESLEIR